MWVEILNNGGLADMLYMGVEAGHLPAADLPRHRHHDRLRPPDLQPEEAAAGRCRSVRHLRRLLWALVCWPRPVWWTSPRSSPPPISIIGGADGPTAIFVTSRRAPELLGCIRSRQRTATWLWCPSSSRPS